MIVKTSRLKKPDFAKLIEYVRTDKGRRGEGGFEIFHNLNPTRDLATQFQENDRYRKRRRGGVVVYHEMLSFHPKDRSNITGAMLEDLARKYIELRGSSALCYGAAHLAEDHPHVHLVFSGTECCSKKTLRLGNVEFRKVRIELEKYQLEKYPVLEHSIVYLEARERSRRTWQGQTHPTDREHQYQKRTGEGRGTVKGELSRLVSRCFDAASDLLSFRNLLRKRGVETYERRGVLTGVVSGNRKWRFRTLSVAPEPLLALDTWRKDLERLRASQRATEREPSRQRSRWQ
ncbi:relaxase/mobilization nuclease domain-containing protein [Rhodothermus sp. AH-315-K08]|nr:relaxase/mobilization nuclease domain-containing protein [Rhodothermus sp. AH-315-K08]